MGKFNYNVEAIDTIASMSKMTESISKMTESISKMIDFDTIAIMNNMTESISKMIDFDTITITNNTIESMSKMTESLSKVIDFNTITVTNNMIESMSKMTESISKMIDFDAISIMNNMTESLRAVERNLMNSLDVSQFITDEIYNSIKNLKLINEDDFRFNDFISMSEEYYYENKDSESLYNTLNNLVKNIQNEQPAIMLLFVNIIIPIILIIFQNMRTDSIVTENNYYIENNYYMDNNIEKRPFSKNIGNYFNSENCYRYVTKDNTRIYMKKNTKSNVAFKINKGVVLKIIKQEKKWSEIEYRNNDVVITGYILNKYLYGESNIKIEFYDVVNEYS